MKRTKRIFAIFMTLALAMSMLIVSSAVSFAEGETPATSFKLIGGEKGHTYTLYQIFTGTVNGTELKGIQWGADVTDSYKSGKTAAAAAAEIAQTNDAHATAKALVDGNYLNSANAKKVTLTADGDVEFTNLAAGYYVLVDTVEQGATTDQDHVYSSYVVKLVGNVTGKLKSDVPTVEKKVDDDDYTTNDGWNDAGDFSMGDTVPYKLTGTIAENYKSFETYKYIFHDTLSKGQAFQRDSLHVYVGNIGTDGKVTIDTTKDITSSFTVSPVADTDGKTETNITVSCSDLTKVADLAANNAVVVTYDAILTQDAEVGLDGNNNKVYLEFSNNPEDGGKGTSRTKDDEVLVFTYELDTTKIDADSKAKLEGAKFVLKNADGKFAILDSNKKVTGWADTQADGTELVSGSDGKFVVIGLDAGNYALIETKAPAGYKQISGEIAVKVVATQRNLDTYKENANDATPGSVLTAISSEVTIPNHDPVTTAGSTDTGIVTAEIANDSGATLPETGGIGTVIFYVLGSLLVVGCGIVLISKRRMESR